MIGITRGEKQKSSLTIQKSFILLEFDILWITEHWMKDISMKFQTHDKI